MIVITQRPLPPPPASVTALQARRALRRASEPGGLAWAQGIDLRAAVDAYLDSDPTGDLREDWDYMTELRRDSDEVETARVALQLTQMQMDDLFRLAAML